MATGQVATHKVLLAPGVLLVSGTTHGTSLQAYRLIANTDKGFTNYVQPFDLVVNTTDWLSAHVLKVIDNSMLLLDKDIFTAVSKNFKVLRGARYAILPPPGLHLLVMGVRAFQPRANAYWGIEIQDWDDFARRRQFLYVTGSNGTLEKTGQELGVTNEVGLLLVNYVQHNVTARIDARDVTV